ncbi:hypothetical protein AB1K70_18885 [Bremerella sp. JC770]|uniref:hypothetical protein n=1 Tax=Bremerella sp. JC770 TaxID=3232137 RepID=UPI0034599EFE
MESQHDDRTSPAGEQRHGAPYFSLASLFLWLTVLGMTFAYWKWFCDYSLTTWGRTPKWDVLNLRLQYAHIALLQSTGITGMMLLLRWRWQGRKVPWQPGHLILLHLALSITYLMAVRLCWYFPLDGNLDQMQPWRMLLLHSSAFAGALFGAMIYAGGTLVLRGSWVWTITLAILAVQSVCLAFVDCPLFRAPYPSWYRTLQDISPWLFAASYAALLLAAIWGVFQRDRRDWLHWAGVGAGLVPHVPAIYNWVL